MDFNYTPEQEGFRRTLRSFLERAKAEVFDRGDDLNVGSDSDDRWKRLLQYHRRLYDAGYVALHWPKEWGGGGAGIVEQAIYQDEALRLGDQIAILRDGNIVQQGTKQDIVLRPADEYVANFVKQVNRGRVVSVEERRGGDEPERRACRCVVHGTRG